jgi:hypothetical protein
MSVRPYIPSYPVIVNGDMSAASLTSTITIIQKMSLMSYSYSWSGTSPVGTIKVQVSNDYAENSEGGVSNAGTWNDLVLNYGGAAVSSVPVSGNTGNGYIDIGPVGGYAIRTIYTKTSGTGTLQAVFNSKVF